MSFYFNGAQANVTLNTSGTTEITPTGEMPANKTPIVKSYSNNFGAAGSATYYTPTAGKILYITSIIMTGSPVAYFRFGDNITAAAAHGTLYDNSVMVYPNGIAVQLLFPIPLKIAVKLQVYVTSATAVCLNFAGYEVDA